jgi:hypothetical protein
MSLLKDQIEIEIQEAELATQKTLAGFPPLIRWITILTAIAIIPTYFIAKSSAYKVWQNRYAQGMLIAKPSFENPLPPKTSNVYLTTLGPLQFAAAIFITNQNLDLSITKAPFEFTFLNAAGQTVYTYSADLFLLPNEAKYIVVPTFSAQDKIAFANFKFLDGLKWQKRLLLPKIVLAASLPNTYNQLNPSAFTVEGTFTNNSSYQLKQVKLTFILEDFAGTIIGSSSRDEFTVGPFEKRSYKQLWPNLNGDNIKNVKVFATTNILDPDNLTLPDFTSDASDLSRPKSGNDGR